MKTPDELNALKEEVETLNKKLAELNEDELTQVAGGFDLSVGGEKSDQLVGFIPGFAGFP